MPRFLVEVPHAADQYTCLDIARTFLQTGSHFLTHAEWGCKDGVHKAWVFVDVDTHEEARLCVPHAFREQAIVVQVNRFELNEIEDILGHHSEPSSDSE